MSQPKNSPPPVSDEPEPIVIVTNMIDFYRQQAVGLREFFARSDADPTGLISAVMLQAAVQVLDDFLSPITQPFSGERLRVQLDLLPSCIAESWQHFPAIMLTTVSDLASSFCKGFSPADTVLGALAMDLILEEADFIAENWIGPVNPADIDAVRDLMYNDTEHQLYYLRTEPLGEEGLDSLFESYFDHENGLNGLHPWVETER
ncbi:hypothetical protein [Microcella sp.]|uniref:hypothetical protein n=1 Tax=Microcella sp. TaxID=1913979 RepID=UPI00391C2A20